MGVKVAQNLNGGAGMGGPDIIDRIDALVDEQLSNYGNRSGYDHDVNQERCRCGRDWHGLPITERIEEMRSLGEVYPGYVFAEDDSPVMCVGSNTPGPWRVEPWLEGFNEARESAYQAAERHVQRLIDRQDIRLSDDAAVSHRARSAVYTAARGTPLPTDDGFDLSAWTNIGTVESLAAAYSDHPDFNPEWERGIA